MTLLILGVALWWAAHLFKRLAPGPRGKLGDPGKGLVAVAIVLSVVLMVIGYRGAEGAVFWGRSAPLVGINNLLMVVAFYVYAVGGPAAGKPRVWLGTKMRHPQLTGFSLWAVAHLLVNGDVASFVLFGGLLIWALVEIALINSQEPAWTPPAHGGARKEAIYVVLTLVIVTVVMLIHNWLGVQPWG
ncbi:NnrU family protein [Flavimaricola marinus]|uniref:NnrU protein n=1 Tax=Flavimaricola marinus TaxID=1819565 RepID=A0A238L8Z3_9RHOB|nr:NnrU family protein [Flavimaricola marinus]SMY06071.1 NnrU protein [Flavimaricola marinus]